MSGSGVFIALILLLLVGLTALAGWRILDRRSETRAWKILLEAPPGERPVFDPAIVADLPEPARRYFSYTIQPGTVLHRAVEIEMTGELGLGTRAEPNYRPMRARQILGLPNGFVWSLQSAAISGSDGTIDGHSWTRFWLFNLFPVARAGGPDHYRSSFGRLVADSAVWAPASLLPAEHVSWQPLDSNSARVTVRYGELEQAVDVHVNDEGAPVRVVFQRWSDANEQGVYQLQPFGGDLSEFQHFAGYQLPGRVLAGNHYGTPDYFPFFKATVTAVRFR